MKIAPNEFDLDFHPILYPDSYKQSHFKFYPDTMARLAAYIEPRFGAGKSLDHIVVFTGIQYYVMKYLMRRVRMRDIREARDLMAAHGEPFNYEGWKIVVKEYGGYLPVRIHALPEGTVHWVSTPQVQVTTEDDRLAWLATYIETSLLRAVWYPSTVATNSFLMKILIRRYLARTCDDPEAKLPFMLHDFGGRGATSGESAMVGGMAHLINFMGTDTSEALIGAARVYGEACAGYSIPAIEHSAIMSWGRSREADCLAHAIEQFDGEGKLFSFVADTYDLFNFVDTIVGGSLKDKILAMEGKIVIRPDSGDPVETPVKVIKRLWDIFGGTINAKGYKVLDSRVGVIQGDGMNQEKITRLYQRLIEEGFSAENCAVGMGGGLLQQVMRDDLGYAMKANYVEYKDGTQMNIQKKPSTDPTKTSKAGLQAVVVDRGEIDAIPLEQIGDRTNLLQLVYDCGQMVRRETLTEIRSRANAASLDFSGYQVEAARAA